MVSFNSKFKYLLNEMVLFALNKNWHKVEFVKKNQTNVD